MWPHGQSVFDEDDCGNWADCWFYGTRVGTRVGHTGPGYPSTRVLTSLIEAKDDGGGGDNWITGAISRANSSQIITTNKPTSSFFTGRMPFLMPNQQWQSTEGNGNAKWYCSPLNITRCIWTILLGSLIDSCISSMLGMFKPEINRCFSWSLFDVLLHYRQFF